jgi:predicted secreted Zn-dependent protease
MLLCVNTLPTYTTSASVSIPSAGKRDWHEFFDGVRVMAVNGDLHLEFLPLEVKVFVSQVK